MGFILLSLFSVLFAGDVVELEPVSADSPKNDYGCNGMNQGSCNADPYCYWASGVADAAKKCIDDPCLRYSDDGTCPEGFTLDGGVGTVNCATRTLTNFQNHDCTGNPGTGQVCSQSSLNKLSLITYCEYTQLKDNVCPDSICMKRNIVSNAIVAKHCIRNNGGGSRDYPCIGLSDNDCKLVPKCYLSGGVCTPDPCFQKKPDVAECSGVTLGSWGTFAAGTCTDWHPYAYTDGAVLNYCIHKDNVKANTCYFGLTNVTDGTNDYPYDWSANWRSNSDHGTYPTYNYGTTNPDCQTDGLSHCEGHGECKTIVNLRGAFAGKYCTDGTHAAAYNLHIPSLLVFVFALVSVFLL